jgi:ABC-type proline/glycine betaine transport system permease subunit
MVRLSCLCHASLQPLEGYWDANMKTLLYIEQSTCISLWVGLQF